MAALRSARPLHLGGTLDLSVAGAESNVAIGLARLGHDTRWIGVTGDDELGRLVLRTLRAEGVDVTHAAVDTAAPTALVVFEPRVADVVRVAYYRTGSAGSRLTPDHLAAALAEGARVVHLTGITAALGPGPRAALETAARTGHATICLDVNHRSKLWSRAAAARVLRPLAPLLDIVVASDDELALVAPAGATTETDRVQALLDLGVGEIVVKRGAAGAEVFTGNGKVARPAVHVPVKNTVGAGDAFVAGYLSALLDGLPAAGRLHRAVTTGAFAVAAAGDWEGLPFRHELDLLDSEPGTTLR
ncbi:sugar kinase [Streptomyces sp. BE20]|uniref:sugar kinase n=1 Tax=Streptomyces sp. BE20 TaxID=3002525 RepID=UPI002E7A6FFF|nr:sugar kinase [Streptomyces sp. BE20]MEE1823664.1 sugar kinase [Streptomyces sp. BE20]